MANPTSPTAGALKVHGINAPKAYPYHPSQVFTNRMRTATLFGEYDSSTGDYIQATLTSPNGQGYPASLPAGRYARAFLCGSPKSTRPGVWVCAWDGPANAVAFDILDGNGFATSASNRIEKTLVTHQGHFRVEIRAAGVSNIRVYYKPHEQYLLFQGLDPDWALYMHNGKFNAIRFMDWMDTNFSIVVTASQRKGYNTTNPDQDHDYYTDGNLLASPGISESPDDAYVRRGATWRSIVRIVNGLPLIKRVQITVPHRVFEDNDMTWLRQLVPYLLAATASDVMLEFEPSNEVWNYSFGGARGQTSMMESYGVNGIGGGIFAARTTGTANDKMNQAYGHFAEKVFRIALEAAGANAHRIKRTIGVQATNDSYFHNFRTRTGQASNVPFAYDHIAPSFYYGNILSSAKVFAISGLTGTFAVNDSIQVTSGGTGTGRFDFQVSGSKVLLEVYSGGFVTGQTIARVGGGASCTLGAETAISTELASWSPAQFDLYAASDIANRVFGPAGLQTTAARAAADNATLLPYEGSGHEWGGNLSAAALTALYAYYDSIPHGLRLLDLAARVRGIATSEGHGYWYTDDDYPWGPYNVYLDPVSLASEVRYQAWLSAATAMLGGGGGGDPNEPPVITNPGTQNFVSGAFVSFNVPYTDPEAEPCTPRVTGLPAGLSFVDKGTVVQILGQLATNAHQNSPYGVVVRVTDPRGAFDEEAFNIVVSGGGGGGEIPPAIEFLANRRVPEGSFVAIQARLASGTMPVEWELTGAPPGVSINEATGFITGQLTPGIIGDYNLVVTATNAFGEDSKPFTLTIEEGGGGPIPSPIISSGATRVSVSPIIKNAFPR